MSSSDAPPPPPAQPTVAPGAAPPPSGPSAPKPKSGMRVALEFSGIPPSWLDKRPRLPSRNWLIFISVTSSLTGLYFYDRRECRRARETYVEKVKHLAEVPMHSMDMPRKVSVYGAKWPGDEDYDRNMKYFRKYVKVRAAALS
jgi:import inner membrane translocase subunit TIM54